MIVGWLKRVEERRRRREGYFAEEGVVDLFCGADFYCFHHSSGGDDYAAEGGAGAGYGCGHGCLV